MSEHLPKNITETFAWCGRCRRQTKHRVSGGRVLHCLEHLVQELTHDQQRRREKRKQLELFKEFE